MTRDPRFDVLFEPVKIAPVTAKNRFYRVLYCNCMGKSFLSFMAEMRRTQAEGIWLFIFKEEIKLHPSGDHSPWTGGRLQDDIDIPLLAKMCEVIHEFGSLAGAAIHRAGQMAANRFSRKIPLAHSHRPIATYDPVQVRAMGLLDIQNLRK